MKETILYAFPFYFFWFPPNYNKRRFMLSALPLVNNEIDRDRYEVDHIDLDMDAIKQRSIDPNVMTSEGVMKLIESYKTMMESKDYKYILFTKPASGSIFFNNLVSMMIYYMTKDTNSEVYVGGSYLREEQAVESKTREDLRKEQLNFYRGLRQKGIFKEPPDYFDLFIETVNFDDYVNNNHVKWPDVYNSSVTLTADVWNLFNYPDESKLLINKFQNLILRDYDIISQPLRYKPINIDQYKYTYNEILKPSAKKNIDKSIIDSGYIKMAELKLSHGCPFSCSFCSCSSPRLSANMAGFVLKLNRYFNESTDFFLLPLEKMKEVIMSHVDAGFNSFFFLDRTSNAWPEELFEWIVRSNLKIYWSSSFTIRKTNPDYLNMIYEAGCRFVDVGLESMSNRMLKVIHKGINVDDAQNFLDCSHEVGLFVGGNFIFGMPTEEMSDITETLKFIIKNVLEDKLNRLSLNAFRLSSASRFFHKHEDYDMMYIDKDGNEYGLSQNNISMNPEMLYVETSGMKKGMSASQLEMWKVSLTNKIIEYLYSNELKLNERMYDMDHHEIFTMCDIYKTKEKVLSALSQTEI